MPDPQKPLFSSDELTQLANDYGVAPQQVTQPTTPAQSVPYAPAGERVMRPGILPHVGATLAHVLGGILSAEGGPAGALISGGSDAAAQWMDSPSPVNEKELLAETALGAIPLGKIIGEAKPGVSAAKRFITNAGRMAAYTEATNAIRRGVNEGIQHVVPQSKSEWLGDLVGSGAAGLTGGLFGSLGPATRANTFNKVEQKLAEASEKSPEGQATLAASSHPPATEPTLVRTVEGKSVAKPIIGPDTQNVGLRVKTDPIDRIFPSGIEGNAQSVETAAPESPKSAALRKELQQRPTAVPPTDIGLGGVTTNPDLIRKSLNEASDLATEEGEINLADNRAAQKEENQLLNKESTADRQAIQSQMGGTDLGTIQAKAAKVQAKATADAEKAAQLEAAQNLRDQMLESGELEPSSPVLTESTVPIPTAAGKQVIRQTYRPIASEGGEGGEGPETSAPFVQNQPNAKGEYLVHETDPQKVASMKFTTYEGALHAMAGSGKVGKIANDGKGAWYVRYPDIAPLTPADLLKAKITDSLGGVTPQPPEAPEATLTAGQEPSARDLSAQAPPWRRKEIDVSGEPKPVVPGATGGDTLKEVQDAMADLMKSLGGETSETPTEAPSSPVEASAESGQGEATSPATEASTEAPTTASVPFTITRDTRQQLYDLGYNKADVNKMTPQQALDTLAAKTTKVAPTTASVPTEAPEPPPATSEPPAPSLDDLDSKYGLNNLRRAITRLETTPAATESTPEVPPTQTTPPAPEPPTEAAEGLPEAPTQAGARTVDLTGAATGAEVRNRLLNELQSYKQQVDQAKADRGVDENGSFTYPTPMPKPVTIAVPNGPTITVGPDQVDNVIDRLTNGLSKKGYTGSGNASRIEPEDAFSGIVDKAAPTKPARITPYYGSNFNAKAGNAPSYKLPIEPLKPTPKSLPDLLNDYRTKWDKYYDLKSSKGVGDADTRAAAVDAAGTQAQVVAQLRKMQDAGEELPTDLLKQAKFNTKLLAKKTTPIPANPDSDQLAAMPEEQQNSALNKLVNQALSKGKKAAKGETGAIDPKLATQIAAHIGGALAGSIGGASIASPEHRGRDAFIGAVVGGLAPLLMSENGATTLAKWRAQGMLTSPTTIAKKVLGDNAAIWSEALEGSYAKKDPRYGARLLREFYSPKTVQKFVSVFKKTAQADAAAERYASVPVVRKGPFAWPSRALGAATEATQDAIMRAGLSNEAAKDLTYLGTSKVPFLSTVASLPSKGKLGRTMVPFARIGTNLLDKGARRIPGAQIIQAANPENVATQEAVRRLQAMGVLGAGATGLGYVTGPSQQDVADHPYSTATEKGLETAAMGPYGLPYALGSILKAGLSKSGTTTSQIVKDLGNVVSQQMPLPRDINPIELLQTLLVPNVIRNISRLSDNGTVRKTNGDVLDPIAADIPGLRQNLPERSGSTPLEQRALTAYLKALHEAEKNQ